MLFHNKMLTALEAGVPGHPDSFDEARRLVTLHYHWLILHGRYICTARKPRCGDCLIRDLCQYEEKT